MPEISEKQGCFETVWLITVSLPIDYEEPSDELKASKVEASYNTTDVHEVVDVACDSISPCSTLASTNLAQGRPTDQSTTSHGGVSDRAVDGNRDYNYGG